MTNGIDIGKAYDKKGNQYWTVTLGGDREFTFDKRLELVELWDLHTGEEVIYHTKKDLEWIKTPGQYKYPHYVTALNALKAYLSDPAKQRKEQRELTSMQNKAMAQRIAKGKYCIFYKIFSGSYVDSEYADTIDNARRKAVATLSSKYPGIHRAYIDATKDMKRIGEVWLETNDRSYIFYWTAPGAKTLKGSYLVNKDGTLSSTKAKVGKYLIEAGYFDKYFANTLQEAIVLGMRLIQGKKADFARIYTNTEKPKEIGLVSMKPRQRNPKVLYWRVPGDYNNYQELNPDGTLKR